MSVILTRVVELATDTFLLQQETVIRGAPQISENGDPLFSGSVRIAQLEKTAAHFEKTAAHSGKPVAQSVRSEQPTKSTAGSLRKLLKTESENTGSPF